MSQFSLLLLLVVALYPTLIHADYTIDDSDYSTLKFSENPAGPVWGPFGSVNGEVLEIRLPNGTMQTIDATQCYDGTYTCSGITIYVLQAGPQGMSASLSIDSGTATTATLDAPPPPQYYIPLVILFNVQKIPSGTHTATMTVLDWDGGFSGMMLDYIDVNQAEVASPTTSSSPAPSPSSGATQSTSPSTSSPTSTGSPASSQQASSVETQTDSAVPTVTVASIISVFSCQSSLVTALPSSTSSGGDSTSPNSLSSTSKKTNVAAVVGGAVGGAIGLLALLALGFYCFRLRRRQRLQALNERPSPLVLPYPEIRYTDTDHAIVNAFAASYASQPPGITHPFQTSTFNVATQDLTSSSPRASIGTVGVAATPPDRNSPTPTQLHSPVRPGPVGYHEKSRGSTHSLQEDPRTSLDAASTGPSGILTDEQADFVNGLFNNNVPAPVVARVLERMLANPRGGVSVNDPEVHALIESGYLISSSQTLSPRLPTVSDHEDGETTIGTAPPSYELAQAQ